MTNPIDSLAPLAGVRVVEVANWVAGPSCAAVMADLGADVIKVEPPVGDSMRGRLRQPKVPEGTPTTDYPFQMDNRGKRSIAVALDDPDGPAIVHRLAASADVFITNLINERQGRYQLSFDDVRAVNPRVVYASLSGYGPRGDEADKTAFDMTAFFARGGVASVVGETAPARFRPGQGDHVAALSLLSGVLAALRLRDRTDEAQLVEVSLLRNGVWTLACDMASTLIDGHQPTRRTRSQPVNVLMESYQCGDGKWLQLSAAGVEAWPVFCAVIGRPDLENDPRFDTLEHRYENGLALMSELDGVFATAPRAEWGRRFDEAKLTWGKISDLPDVAEDPQVRAAGAITKVDHPVVGTFETVAAPFDLPRADVGVRGPAPEVGEHSAEVLAELGYDAGAIADLTARGVVGPKPRSRPERRARS